MGKPETLEEAIARIKQRRAIRELIQDMMDDLELAIIKKDLEKTHERERG